MGEKRRRQNLFFLSLFGCFHLFDEKNERNRADLFIFDGFSDFPGLSRPRVVLFCDISWIKSGLDCFWYDKGFEGFFCSKFCSFVRYSLPVYVFSSSCKSRRTHPKPKTRRSTTPAAVVRRRVGVLVVLYSSAGYGRYLGSYIEHTCGRKHVLCALVCGPAPAQHDVCGS